jgi:hypothetical protein
MEIQSGDWNNNLICKPHRLPDGLNNNLSILQATDWNCNRYRNQDKKDLLEMKRNGPCKWDWIARRSPKWPNKYCCSNRM